MGISKKEKSYHSLSTRRDWGRVAQMIKETPSHVYEVDDKGKRIFVPRTEEIAEKEREWNYMYERSMELLKRARKAKFLGLFGFVPAELREEIEKWQDVLIKWQREFRDYEYYVCPVVSDQKKYIIKGYYLGFYAYHTFGLLDSIIDWVPVGGYIFHPAYLDNTEGCVRRFTNLELRLIKDAYLFDRPVVNPKLVGLLNKITSLFWGNKEIPFRETTYFPLFDASLKDLTPEEQALKNAYMDV